jgi:uncharacterized protein YxjI
MAAGSENTITGVDLTGETYTVEQGLVRAKYKAMDEDGNVVLRAKKKLVSIGDKFPFQDDDGNEVFKVSSELSMNMKRDYVMVDSQTDEEVALLDNKLSLMTQKWQVRDPDTENILATIETRSAVVALARGQLGMLGKLFPVQFDIKDADGNVIGGIDGQLSMKDRYDVSLDDAGDLPRETIIAAAMVIDAIEGN